MTSDEDRACGFCGKPVSLAWFHIDHIQPVAMGGTGESTNKRLAHPYCNISAGSKVRAGLPARWHGPTYPIRLTIPAVLVRELWELAVTQNRSLTYVIYQWLRNAPPYSPSPDQVERGEPLTVRLPLELVNKLQAIAKAEDRSVNYIAIRLMRLGLAAERGELG